MQTERVTFLTTPDHKAALDAFASQHGMSVGHVVREASSRYIARPASEADEEEALAALLPEVEAAVQDMRSTIAEMRADIERTCAVVDAVLAGEKA
jgi:ATP phosphoribosyltransferase